MADLRTTVCGIQFPNPIWTAAGPAACDAEMLWRAARGGAGALVTKTLCVHPARVPIPNIAAPVPGHLLNAELWSEKDYRQFIRTDLPSIRSSGLPILVSVGYSAEDLAELGIALDKSKVVDGIEFSIHYVDKSVENLRCTAKSLKQSVSVPIFAKLSPSVQSVADIVSALDDIVDGYVAINSVGPALDFDPDTLQPMLGSEDGRGWLSGRAILPIGLHFVAALANLTRKPVIGVGGIRKATDAVKYIMAGASAVQVCTLAILKGQAVYGQLATELARWMDNHGYATIEQLRGAFHRRARVPTFVLGDGPQLYPVIANEKCTYCDLCVRGCVHEAIQLAEREFVLDRSACVSCGLCISLCPTNALTMQAEHKPLF